MHVAKSRGINADIQSPRTKLLYFICSAPNSRIKAEPGVKSNLSSVLGYKSEFALYSTASISNSIMIVMGIAIVVFTFSLELKLVPIISVAFFGIVLIVIGFSFLLLSKNNKPQLPPEAKDFLKEVNRH